MDAEPDKWFEDKLTENLAQLHRIKEVVYTGKTRFQSVQFLRTGGFGLSLVLDGKIQSSEADEFIYHEALVQTPMIAHPHPETVFIAGGGEGATLREALTHKTVKRAVMVDLDAEVVSLCRKYLPGHSKGAFEDKRTELLHVDARKYLAESRERFDVVIIDLTDPTEAGPAYLLYTREFYQIVQDRLTNNGVISVQSGSASLIDLLGFTAVYRTLKSVFPAVFPYQTNVPSFGNPWGFCLAFKNNSATPLPSHEVDARILKRLTQPPRFYDGLTHQGIFSLPKYIRDAMSRQTRLISDKEPIYIYHK